MFGEVRKIQQALDRLATEHDTDDEESLHQLLQGLLTYAMLLLQASKHRIIHLINADTASRIGVFWPAGHGRGGTAAQHILPLFRASRHRH
jgi:hypothetical protein